MDGLFHGKPLLKFMIWGETPLFVETPIYREQPFGPFFSIFEVWRRNEFFRFLVGRWFMVGRIYAVSKNPLLCNSDTTVIKNTSMHKCGMSLDGQLGIFQTN